MKNRKEEQEAIRTTIVGGRPPGCGQPVGEIPYGIEILVKKAAVDVEFKKLLLDKREKAAETIGLDLNSSEIMMLKAVTKEQLEVIINETFVKPENKSSLMGKVAAVMIAALGFSVTACSETPQMCGGIRPPDIKEVTDNKEVKEKTNLESNLKLDIRTRGIRPDHPVLQKIDNLVTPKKKLTDEVDSKKLTAEAQAKPDSNDNEVYNNPDAYKDDINSINFGENLIDKIDKLAPPSRGISPDRPRPMMTKGIRPDRPYFPPPLKDGDK